MDQPVNDLALRRLMYLQTHNIPEEDYLALAAHNSKLHDSAIEHLRAVILSDMQVGKYRSSLNLMTSGWLYYSKFSSGQIEPYPEIVAFAAHEISSYATNAHDADDIMQWADEQGLNYCTDSVIVEGTVYYRVLSKPVLTTQTSKSGVVYMKNEVIDFPHRATPSLAKALERHDNLIIPL